MFCPHFKRAFALISRPKLSLVARNTTRSLKMMNGTQSANGEVSPQQTECEMKKLPKTQSKGRLVKLDGSQLENQATLASDALNAGEIIALPTDTIYGVCAHAQNIDAVNKLYAVKGRDERKPIAIRY